MSDFDEFASSRGLGLLRFAYLLTGDPIAPRTLPVAHPPDTVASGPSEAFAAGITVDLNRI